MCEWMDAKMAVESKVCIHQNPPMISSLTLIHPSSSWGRALLIFASAHMGLFFCFYFSIFLFVEPVHEVRLEYLYISRNVPINLFTKDVLII